MNGHALCPPPLVGRGRASFFGDRSAPAVGQKAFPCHVPHAKKVLERSSIILQTVGGLLGLLAVPEITKRFLYPAAAPVGNLHQRLKSTGRKLRSPIVKFAIKPYQEITEDRALILQGRNQEGKTTLLRETIPRHRRWGPLALEGIYLNGAKGKGVDSFKEWLTTQMFGMTTTGGSEIDYNLQAYRSKQWFVGFLENLGLPIAPKPTIVLVDQFEELLKRFPVQALDWANTLTNQHTRDNLARVIFVCNSDAGSQSLLNLNQGTRFDRVIMEPVSGEDVMDLNKELFQNCSGNIGMYKLVESRIKRQELTEEQVEDFIRATFHRWELDFHLPYPVKYDRSWAEMDVELMRERMEEFLEQALRAREKDGNKVFTEEQIKLQMGFAKGTWKDPNQQQILDASEELWLERLESVGADKPVAEALASQIKGMICSPVPKRWGCSVSPCVYLYSWRDLKLPRLKGLCCFADVQLCHVNLAFLIVPYFLCGIA